MPKSAYFSRVLSNPDLESSGNNKKVPLGEGNFSIYRQGQRVYHRTDFEPLASVTLNDGRLPEAAKGLITKEKKNSCNTKDHRYVPLFPFPITPISIIASISNADLYILAE